MKPESKPLVALLMVIVLFGGSLAVSFWGTCYEPEEDFSVTGTVTGLSGYNQPKLDVKADVLFDAGLPLGSEFDIYVNDAVYSDAIFMKGYNGLLMFDIFVNVENDGFISIGCMGKLITADKGTEVTITHTGSSERYDSTPLYNAGYTDVRSDYPSDAAFANFYEVTGGDLKSETLYRSFSPLYDPAKQSRSTYVNELAEQADIQFEIALSYTNKTVQEAVEKLDGYCLTLCENGNYLAPGMNYLFFEKKDTTKAVLMGILDNDGAYLVHCNVGRDRTGYTILLLQALCNCTPEEMQACEARAFVNLYNIEVGSKEYDAIVHSTYDRNMYLIANYDQIPNIFSIDWENIDISGVDTYSAAYSYCTEYLGLTDEQVEGIVEKLCG